MRSRPAKRSQNAIPTKARLALAERDGGACFRCGLAASEWHHRRSRRVRDEHTHSPGNGVSLCRACHAWVHQHPERARELGLIVGRDVLDPSAVMVCGYMGWVALGNDGSIAYGPSLPMTSKSNKRGDEMPTTYPSLTEDALPGVRRAWREVVVTLRENPGQWYLIEEGVSRSRAKSIRKAVRYHKGIQVSQRQQKEDGTIAVYARATEETT